MRMNRKKRTDRTHAIYRLWVDGMSYIGVTVKGESTVLKSVHRRIGKHWSRANREDKDWTLYNAMRRLECISEIEFEILATVRGKTAAHAVECDMIREYAPELNSDLPKGL